MLSDDDDQLDWIDFFKAAGSFLLLAALWGLFFLVMSPFITTFQWIFGLLGWNDMGSVWSEIFFRNLQFGGISTLFIAAVVLSYASLAGLVILAFRLTNHFNKNRLAYFAEQHPGVYDNLQESIGSITTNLAVWWFASIVVWVTAMVASYYGATSATWVVTGSVTAALGVFYIAMLISANHLRRWAFQYVRGFILPYIFIVTPVFVVFAFLTLLQADIVVAFYSYFGAHETLQPESWSTGFEWEFMDMLQAMASSICGLLIIVWFAPILIKRDYLEIAAVLMALAAPWLGAILLQHTEVAQKYMLQLFEVVPKSVVALAFALTIDWLFGWIKGALVASYVCPVCKNHSRKNIRFCPQCGTPVTNGSHQDIDEKIILGSK